MGHPILWTSDHARQMHRNQELVNPVMLVMSRDTSSSGVPSFQFAFLHCFQLIQVPPNTQQRFQRLIFEVGRAVNPQYVIPIPKGLVEDVETIFVSPAADDVRFTGSEVMVHATFTYPDDPTVTRHRAAQCIENADRSAVLCRECELRLHAQLTLLNFIQTRVDIIDLEIETLGELGEHDQKIEAEKAKLVATATLIEFCVSHRPPCGSVSGASTPHGHTPIPPGDSQTPRPTSRPETPPSKDSSSGPPTTFSPIKA